MSSSELIYTSAPRGLKPGSRGFSTVAVTVGLPPAMVERLESLSGYRPILPATDPAALARNPINVAHYRLNVGGRQVSVLSRVAFAGLDYTQRSNKLAHHLLVETADQSPAGPAWLAEQPGVFAAAWDQEPAMLPPRQPLPHGTLEAAPCDTWARLAGDAGWAGLMAEMASLDPRRPCWIIARLGDDVMALLAEAVALVPPAQRWKVTFSTYFTDAPGDATCAWRCVYAGTPAAQAAARAAGGTLVVDLAQPQPLSDAYADNPWVISARTGAPLPETVPDRATANLPVRQLRPAALVPKTAAGGSIDLSDAEALAGTGDAAFRSSARQARPATRAAAVLLAAAACIVSAGLGALIATTLFDHRPALATTASTEPSPPPAPPATPVAPPTTDPPASGADTADFAKAKAEFEKKIDGVEKRNTELQKKVDGTAGETQALSDQLKQQRARADAAVQATVKPLVEAMNFPPVAAVIDKTDPIDLPVLMPATRLAVAFPHVPKTATWQGHFWNGGSQIDLVSAASMAFVPVGDPVTGYNVTWHKTVASKIGGDQDSVLARLAFQQSRQQWELEILPPENRNGTELVKSLYQELRWMTLQPEGKPIPFQLFKPATLAVALESAKSLQLLLPAVIDRARPYAPRITGVSRKDWTAVPGPTPNVVTMERRPDATTAIVRFSLKIVPVFSDRSADSSTESRVESDWADRTTLFQSARDLVAPLADLIQSIDADTDALCKLAPNSPEAGALVTRVNAWKKTMTDRYQSPVQALATMNERHFRAYADLSDLLFVVTLDNGAVVAHLTPTTMPAAAPSAAQGAP